jgi:RNA polymerase sigma-70 factor (ECF subfamily)
MIPPSDDHVANAVADAHRREWAFVLAATARVASDIDLAEECVQDAYVSALEAWKRVGVPDNPGAWLTTAARRKAIDALRRDQTLRSKLPLLVEPVEPVIGGPDEAMTEHNGIPDDRLRLVFTCCHPALAREAQVALTLRLVCGLTTTEIAQAFIVSEPTMAARVTRAKKKISAARIAYRVPDQHELPDRLDAVLTVVHLLYTTGHTAPSGAILVRRDLVERALDLARMLQALMPDEGEIRGLLALLLLTNARAATRTAPDGRLLLLEEQDRSRWDRDAIAAGVRLVLDALHAGRPGRFTLQAAIAALHAEAPSYAETDWRQLLALYDALLRIWPSPVVALNRAVPVAMVHGPELALALVDDLATDRRLDGYRYLPATRADLLRRLGRWNEAASAYEQALSWAENDAERAYLAGRIAECASASA